MNQVLHKPDQPLRPAAKDDLAATQDWQTNRTTPFAAEFPHKAALYQPETKELLGLISYEPGQGSLAIEGLCLEYDFVIRAVESEFYLQ